MATTDAQPVVLERDRELERLRAALADAASGAGGIVLVEGPAGIGKTTLAAAAREIAKELGMRSLRASGNQLERDLAYGVVQQLFDPVLRAADEPTRARLLEGAEAAEPALRVASNHQTGGSEYTTLHALYWLLANLSDEQPLLVVVDDAHWADQASARFLAFLAPRLNELRVLLLICARPDEWSPEELFAATASDAAARPLVPAPLSTGACDVLIRGRFDEPVDEQFSAACHTATGGNPFLLRALLDELANDRLPPRPQSVHAVLAMGPRVVTRAIVARLGRLGPGARPLAAALVTLGDGASTEELAALAGLSRAEQAQAAAELERVSIAVQRGGLRFAHPIIRNAVSADMAPGEQDRLHREAAALLEREGAPPERIAAHLLMIEPAGDERVYETLRKAANVALTAGAIHSAVAYLRRALTEPGPESDRADLLVELGRAEEMIDGRAAIAHLAEALELTEDHGRYVEIASLLAYVLTYSARAEEAVSTALKALSRLGDDEPDLRLRLQSSIMRAGEHDPTMLAAQKQAQAEVRTRLKDIESAPGLGARTILAMLAYERMSELREPAAELGPHAEELLADELPLKEDNGGTAFIAPIQILIAADSENAIPWLDRGLERARKHGDGFAVAADLFFSCYAHLCRGDLADAVLDGTDGLEAIDRWGVEAASVWCSSALAEAQIACGHLDRAQRTLARVAGADDELPDTLGWDEFRWTSGTLMLAKGDPKGCMRRTADAAALNDEPTNPSLMPWRSRIAVCLTLLDEDHARAITLVEEELELARRWGAPRTLGVALRARGLVLGDKQGQDSLREAVSVLEASPAKLERAHALVELGAMLRRTGQRRDARDPLRDGLKLARECGATPLAERADDELRATGASSRNVIRSGLDALTSSERRVVKMAASGMSNKQIAQALFVTVKTVETHLHRSYQKLDVSSRAELGEALKDAP